MTLNSSTRVLSRLAPFSHRGRRVKQSSWARSPHFSSSAGKEHRDPKTRYDSFVLLARPALPFSSLSKSGSGPGPGGLPRARYFSANSGSHYEAFRNRKRNENVVISLIAANAVVFGAWWYLGVNDTRPTKSLNQQTLYNALQKYCLLSWSRIRDGNYVPVIGSAFSHINVGHFAFNMITLYSFGGFLAGIPGMRSGHLLQLTLGSAICGSLGFLAHEQYRNPQRASSGSRQFYSPTRDRVALGASGIVMGIGTAAAILVPRAPFLLMGIVPLPLWLLTGGYFFYDAYYLNDPRSTISHSGHLGGMAFGAAYCLLRLRRLRPF